MSQILSLAVLSLVIFNPAAWGADQIALVIGNAEYKKAPEVTKRRIYLETMAETIPNLGRKVILDDEGGQVLPLRTTLRNPP